MSNFYTVILTTCNRPRFDKYLIDWYENHPCCEEVIVLNNSGIGASADPLYKKFLRIKDAVKTEYVYLSDDDIYMSEDGMQIMINELEGSFSKFIATVDHRKIVYSEQHNQYSYAGDWDTRFRINDWERTHALTGHVMLNRLMFENYKTFEEDSLELKHAVTRAFDGDVMAFKSDDIRFNLLMHREFGDCVVCSNEALGRRKSTKMFWNEFVAPHIVTQYFGQALSHEQEEHFKIRNEVVEFLYKGYL